MKQASGELATRTVAMPRDTNPNGDIFGGWLVSEMDIAGGILSHLRSNKRTVTVAIDAMVFHRPVKVGDIVACYGEVLKIGTTSIAIKVEAWSTSRETGKDCHVTEGIFTYVAIDDKGRPTPVDG